MSAQMTKRAIKPTRAQSALLKITASGSGFRASAVHAAQSVITKQAHERFLSLGELRQELIAGLRR